MIVVLHLRNGDKITGNVSVTKETVISHLVKQQGAWNEERNAFIPYHEIKMVEFK